MPTAFMTGRPVRARMAETRSGVSRPCSWIRSGASAATAASSSASVGIDQEQHALGAALRLPGRARARVELDMPGRSREAHEADHVGARVERGFERFGR